MSSIYAKTFSGFLFDMDGTIVNSKASADRIWGKWAVDHGLDVDEFLPKMHGSRSIDTLRRLNLPGVDPEHEADLIETAEAEDVGDVVEIPGARAFLESLPAERWALVTSSSKKLVLRRLEAARLPVPLLIVTADEVTAGKPDPESYLLAARKIGSNPRDCLVFEDTLPGAQAGASAGANVLLISSVHEPPLVTEHASVRDFRNIAIHQTDDHNLCLIEL